MGQSKLKSNNWNKSTRSVRTVGGLLDGIPAGLSRTVSWDLEGYESCIIASQIFRRNNRRCIWKAICSIYTRYLLFIRFKIFSGRSKQIMAENSRENNIEASPRFTNNVIRHAERFFSAFGVQGFKMWTNPLQDEYCFLV